MNIFDFMAKVLGRMGITKNHWPLFLREYCNMQSYKAKMGYTFDLNKPRLFTEKIQWYKSRYNNPDLVRCVDKYLFKGYIREKLGEGYTAPLYGAWTDVASFAKDWDSLPEKFVLKSTLQSDDNYVRIIEKSKIDKQSLLKEMIDWFIPRNLLINSFCSAYYKAVPRVLAEMFIDTGSERLEDYKFFCFNGKPYCAYVDDNHRIAFYDINWKKIDVKYENFPNDFETPVPIHFDDMRFLAEKLSKDFPFVRVDFYDTPEKLYLGELTFYPGGGFSKYAPVSFNEQLGNMFDMNFQ